MCLEIEQTTQSGGLPFFVSRSIKPKKGALNNSHPKIVHASLIPSAGGDPRERVERHRQQGDEVPGWTPSGCGSKPMGSHGWDW